MVRGPAPVTRQGLPLVAAGSGSGPSLVVAMTVAAVPLSSVFMQHATREADHVIADAQDAGMRALREAAFGGRRAGRHLGNWTPFACAASFRVWSGRRESNPHCQLGKLMFCH